MLLIEFAHLQNVIVEPRSVFPKRKVNTVDAQFLRLLNLERATRGARSVMAEVSKAALCPYLAGFNRSWRGPLRPRIATPLVPRCTGCYRRIIAISVPLSVALLPQENFLWNIDRQSI